jgi:hypothetical protein
MESVEVAYKNLSLTQFLEFLDQGKCAWVVKRLSGNDTGVTGGHQAGIYVPRSFMNVIVPEIVTTAIYNPTKGVDCFIASHDCLKKDVQAKYYNNKFFPERKLKKKYNEFRFTRWIGTPLHDKENTGSVCILADGSNDYEKTLVCWICKDVDEEELVETWLGKEIEPGFMYNSSDSNAETINSSLFKCLPRSWFNTFPSGREIFEFIEKKIPCSGQLKTLDDLLLRRRAFEFKVFSEIERRDVLPNIKTGFDSVDKFIQYANSVANRRKSRTGTSLELHLESIFRNEKLHFEAQVVTEQNKKPDFVFPSARAYHNAAFPSEKLHMLASKTCCKDRWRQVITEADRISTKHLFTLQEGVSSNQLSEMYHHGIIIVVPRPLVKKFPREYRSKIMDLTGFVGFIKNSQKNYFDPSHV